MTHTTRPQRQGLLATELGSFIRLRWAAGLVALGAALLSDQARFAWFSGSGRRTAAAVGVAILLYNAVLWLVLRHVVRRRAPRGALLALAGAQMLLDLTCLTVFTVLTGGISSPVRGFFIFHMVFASLLLPRLLAYGSAGLALLLMTAGLWVTGQWPGKAYETSNLLAWVAMLLVTVWLANGITRRLRRQRRRLSRQNRRIHQMSGALRRQQQALIQHEKMAVAGRMAAGVAHEIANPLASMDGLLQLIARRPDRPRPDAIATLREQVARISQIVRRMNAFAHPGDGQWQVMALAETADRALEVVRFDPRLKRIQVDCAFGDDVPPVRMLPESIQQVVINLIINAVDAMENVGQPRLGLRVYRSNGWCALEVSDNGHGITEENRKRLFEPFFTTKPVGKGTGLGLSITYSLVQAHGGRLDVESTPGKGTRFTVRLPVTSDVPSATGGAATPSPATAASPPAAHPAPAAASPPPAAPLSF